MNTAADFVAFSSNEDHVAQLRARFKKIIGPFTAEYISTSTARPMAGLGSSRSSRGCGLEDQAARRAMLLARLACRERRLFGRNRCIAPDASFHCLRERLSLRRLEAAGAYPVARGGHARQSSAGGMVPERLQQQTADLDNATRSLQICNDQEPKWQSCADARQANHAGHHDPCARPALCAGSCLDFAHRAARHSLTLHAQMPG
jgi:hypothetical protein